MILTNILDSNITWIVFWTIIFIVTVLVEISTTQLVSIWFAGASIVSFILALCSVPYWIQLVVFVFSAVLLLFLSNLLFKDKILKFKKSPTNADSLIGQEIKLTKSVNPCQVGEARVRDVIWTVAVDEEISLSKDEVVIIKEIRGNKLIVTKKN